MHRIASLVVCVGVMLSTPAPSAGQSVNPVVHVLDNGMKFLLLPRKGDPNIAAGWVAKVGSVNERPGTTGVAHLFEHMMFKGTHTLGTLDIHEDLEIIGQLDDLYAKIQVYQTDLNGRQRRGEIENAKSLEVRSEEHLELLAEFEQLLQRQAELLVKNEFDQIYTGDGGSGMNAGTSNDLTIYFINVPANKLELWFWMESDRLENPVFREFYTERDVVHEERRLRTDSTPIGRFQEQFNAMFWQSSPYSWPVVGWPSDLEGLTRAEALEFFDIYYAPNNLTAALVGDFDPEVAIQLAERYFSRLERNPRPPVGPRTEEIEQTAEKRLTAWAETTPQVQIRYHSVADGHVDEPALLVLGQVLSGRTGRLRRGLVEAQGVATQAGGGQNGLKYGGFFEVRGVAHQDHTPEEVEQAIYTEIEKLQQEPIGDRELQKVKNQNAASEFRRLQGNFLLLLQLLQYEAYRGWETINTTPAQLQAVTAADIQRVANTYFAPENRNVAIYYRKESEGAAVDPFLEGLDDQERQQVEQLRKMIGQAPAEQLRAMLGQMHANINQVPEENRDMVEIVVEIIKERLKELEGTTAQGGTR